jgi:hypothetical protein
MSEDKSEEPFHWSDIAEARKTAFRNLLDAPAFNDIFNDKFIEGMEKRRDVLSARSHKVMIVQLSILMILGLGLLSVHLTVSLFGLSSSDTRFFRELLLVVSSTIQIWNVFSTRELVYLSDFLRSYIDVNCRDDENAREVLCIRYGLAPGFSSYVTQLRGKQSKLHHKILLIGACIGFLVWLCTIVIVGITIQVAAMVDIIREPTISTKVSVLVTIYVVVADVVTFGFYSLNGGSVPSFQAAKTTS